MSGPNIEMNIRPRKTTRPILNSVSAPRLREHAGGEASTAFAGRRDRANRQIARHQY